jgi:phosphopantetheinyl transferase (holo-ACP synthase)
MVGNDIVDIREAKKYSSWQRPRFLEKLFTSEEQQLIHDSPSPFLMVWRLWTMKESAYKLYTQTSPSRFYSPRAFQCIIEDSKAIVCYEDFHCNVKTKLTSRYILSEARLSVNKMTSDVVLFHDKNPKIQSEILKSRLLERVSKLYNADRPNLNFKKCKFGIPKVIFNSEKIHVSMTHHGNFGAIAL